MHLKIVENNMINFPGKKNFIFFILENFLGRKFFFLGVYKITKILSNNKK